MIFDSNHKCMIRQFWFDDRHNKFLDEYGDIIFDIFRYITPHEFYNFLEKKEYTCLKKPDNTYIELIYPDELMSDDEDDLPIEYYL